MPKLPVLLAVNVGNSNVTFGALAGQTVRSSVRCPVADEDACRKALNRGRWPQPEAIVVASVNPAADKALCRLLERRFAVRPRYLVKDVPIPMPVRCSRPRKVGADRLANALSARFLAKGPAIVVDFGTAITVDAVSTQGDFLGGAILPGIQLSIQSLRQGTAKLPFVEFKRPRSAIGKQTEEAIRAGIYWGACGAVKEIVTRCRRRLGKLNAPLFATGGDVGLFAGHLPKPAQVVRDLTLRGIAIAFERWQESR